jgi:hypothetical protein
MSKKVRGRGGLQGSRMSRVALCVDNRLTGDREVVSPTLLPRNIILLLLVLISVRG